MLSFLGWIGDHEAIIALLVLAAMFVAFVLERYPPEVVAVAGAATFLVLGLIDTEDALAVLSNSAPVTIAAMFVLSGALVRTGALDAASRLVLARAADRPVVAFMLLLAGTTVASAFMNSTPVVMVLIPIVMQLARSIDEAPSRLLMPLSFMGILGGTCTLIGTSTNLLVAGVAQNEGLAPFTIFEITGLGLIAAVVGGAYMFFIGRRLLPERTTLHHAIGGQPEAVFLTEVRLPKDSPHIGKPFKTISRLNRPEIKVLMRQPGWEPPDFNFPDEELDRDTRLVVTGPASEILGLHEEPGLRIGTRARALPKAETSVMEAIVAPGPSLAGRRIRDLHLPARFGIHPLAVHTHGRMGGINMNDVRLAVGDTLLIDGTPESLANLSNETDLLDLTEPRARPFRREKVPLAIAALAAVVGLAAFGVMPIAGLAIIAVAFVLLTRCVDSSEAFGAIDGGILVLIFAMLAVGIGLEETGAVELLVTAAEPWLRQAPPILILAGIYLLTSVMTEAVTNNAVAVVVTPLAIGLATELGLDPRPFVVAVMFGASASFATPIGYQTNTLVYSAGGYRFSDFVKVGLPINILVGLATMTAIPMFWPLQ